MAGQGCLKTPPRVAHLVVPLVLVMPLVPLVLMMSLKTPPVVPLKAPLVMTLKPPLVMTLKTLLRSRSHVTQMATHELDS